VVSSFCSGAASERVMTDPVALARLDGTDAEHLLGTYALSFPDFYRAHYRAAVALAAVLTGSRSGAEDVVQDVMADAHRRWRTIGAYERPELWLRRAVMNRSTSWRRRAGTRVRGVARLANEPEPIASLDARDHELWAAVRRLPTRQAHLVALVFVDGMTAVDAAAVLDISPSTAKTHLARAKDRLTRDLAAWRTA
jgi:RNA polymerase sigma factor (sigma-70 family)